MSRFWIMTCVLAGYVPGLDAAEQPNIIFIMADDLGKYDLGCYGQENILTPYLDRMAAEGCRFTQCYTGSAVMCALTIRTDDRAAPGPYPGPQQLFENRRCAAARARAPAGFRT